MPSVHQALNRRRNPAAEIDQPRRAAGVTHRHNDALAEQAAKAAEVLGSAIVNDFPLLDGVSVLADEPVAQEQKASILTEWTFFEDQTRIPESMAPKFAWLESYYTGITGRFYQSWWARLLNTGFNFAGIAQNYSPTSYLINTLLPENNKNRSMDYVATIVLQ